MRGIPILIAGAAFVTCTASAEQPMSPKAQATYDRLLAGRVAGAAMTCLPTLSANDMTVVDDNTIVFRNGSRLYVNHPEGGCSQLSQGHTAILTSQYGQTGPCRGDVLHVEDTLSHMEVGSCVYGDFTPYVRKS
jgi:hypothetical protein